LYADGRFATPDGKAHFSVLRPLHAEHAEHAENAFRVSTRRGKQFNSMIQRDVDPLTGAHRDEIFISPDDMGRLQLAEGRRGAAALRHGDPSPAGSGPCR
jgi:hypothetical protein